MSRMNEIKVELYDLLEQEAAYIASVNVIRKRVGELQQQLTEERAKEKNEQRSSAGEREPSA